MLEFDLIGRTDAHEIDLHHMEKGAGVNRKAHVRGKLNHTTFLFNRVERILVGVDKEVHPGSILFKRER